MKTLFAAISALLLFANPVFAGPDIDAAAKDVCKCLEAPHEQVRKAMEMVSRAQASGDMSQLMTAQGEMMGVMGASNQCFDTLTKKYPEIARDEKLQDEVMAEADKECPNPAAQMSMQQ